MPAAFWIGLGVAAGAVLIWVGVIIDERTVTGRWVKMWPWQKDPRRAAKGPQE